MKQVISKDLKRGQKLYIIEAALEYFISILVAGSFLATLTKQLGFSDNLTGILSSMISLGCLFQLLSLSIRRSRVKSLVVALGITNQLLFMMLYVIPLVPLSKQTKIILFVVFIFLAYFTYNLAHPKKISWLMLMVEDSHRGRFTATKEIISLASGMIFSFSMGALIDNLFETGRIRLAFALSAIVIFVLMVLHSLAMIFTVDKQLYHGSRTNLKQTLCQLIKNKDVLKISVVFTLYYMSTYVSTPFYGTYQIGELGLSLKFVSAMVMLGSIARISVSRFWGKYADKNSFAKMIERCFIFLGIAQLCVIFAVPSNGKVMFVLYHIFHGIALGGINSALTNLIFDKAPVENRADSLAITQALAGVVGFVTTLLISPLVSHIQNNGNSLFGIPVYAQQVVTILALIFTVFAVLFTKLFLCERKNKKA